MSASFLRATAKVSPGDSASETAPTVLPISADEKPTLDEAFGGDNPGELTADALQRVTALMNGETPSPLPVAKKPDGDVATDPKVKTPTAEEIAASEAAAAEAAKIAGKTPEELAAEAAKTPEELAADAAAAEAAKAGKTPEEIAAEEAAAAEAAKAGKTPEELAAEEAARLEALKDDEDDKDKVRVRLNRNNFKSDDDFKLARSTTRLMNEFGLSPSEAEAKARELLGIAKPAAVVTPVEVPEVADVKAAEAELAAAKKEFRAARTILDSEAMDAADDKIDAATAKLETARKAVETAQAANDQHQAGIDKAVAEYPGSDDLSTKFGRQVSGLYADFYNRPNDAFWKLPASERPLHVAKLAAAELGIKGKSETVATSPSAAVKPPAPTKPAKVSPVPGKARTVTPTATPEAAADAELAKALGPNAHMLAGIHS